MINDAKALQNYFVSMLKSNAFFVYEFHKIYRYFPERRHHDNVV